MSWHSSHRLTTVHRAVSIALLYSVSSMALSSGAQAATIGKTTITSSQHEPLAASIIVTDIKASDFSASLASPAIYQQMGLTPTDSMTVRFKPTSSTSGQLFISTTQPVSMPFADVVLALNDGDQRNVIPKTLLMPINDSQPTKLANTVVTGAPKPNLPVISANEAKPLTVRQGTPPPLLLSPSLSMPSVQASNLTTTIEPTAKTGNLVDAPNNATATSGLTDKQFDILNIQVTRQIQTSNSVNSSANSVNSSANNAASNTASNSVMAPAPITAAAEKNTKPIFELIPDNSDMPNIAANSGSAKQTAPSAVMANAAASTANKTPTGDSPTANYTVQHNDNLWIISQQIAQKNNLDIQTVMTQIQSQNPDAFVGQDAGQLRADAQLSLPDYDVIPSQQSLQAAISAQRQHTKQQNKPAAKKAAQPKSASSKASKATQASSQPTTKRSEKSAKTTTQALPKARFSVLAPGRDGKADGTQTKAAAATGNGLSTDILATLKSSRQRTAEQANSLSKTNNTLGSYTRKLQLQNQKLAELQARLKKLRNQ